MAEFRKYMEEVRDKGTACDVAREVNSLHQRARELLEYDVTTRVDIDVKTWLLVNWLWTKIERVYLMNVASDLQ
jgi:hypothetical protein